METRNKPKGPEKREEPKSWCKLAATFVVLAGLVLSCDAPPSPAYSPPPTQAQACDCKETKVESFTGVVGPNGNIYNIDINYTTSDKIEIEINVIQGGFPKSMEEVNILEELRKHMLEMEISPSTKQAIIDAFNHLFLAPPDDLPNSLYKALCQSGSGCAIPPNDKDVFFIDGERVEGAVVVIGHLDPYVVWHEIGHVLIYKGLIKALEDAGNSPVLFDKELVRFGGVNGYCVMGGETLAGGLAVNIFPLEQKEGNEHFPTNYQGSYMEFLADLVAAIANPDVDKPDPWTLQHAGERITPFDDDWTGETARKAFSAIVLGIIEQDMQGQLLDALDKRKF